MSVAIRNVLPADATQIVTHAWSVGVTDDFDGGYEVVVINITPAYARTLLALVDLITNQLPPDSILVTPDSAAHYIDFEREETVEWATTRAEVTVLVYDERLSIFEIEPAPDVGFPIRLGERYVEISKEHFRYRAERENRCEDQCIITPDIPVSVLHQIINLAVEVAL